jgi:6-pyruvoyltetrahydropterin/6-carboxytetrahydropterin synthase
MFKIEKILKEFCAAHRLIKGYEGKCQYLHGHSYVVTVNLAVAELDQYGFVMDFVDIKNLCEDWLQENFDHGTLVSSDDAELLKFLRDSQQKHYVIPNGVNTTAECIAQHLFVKFYDLLSEYNKNRHSQIQLIAVRVAETPSSAAIYEPHDLKQQEIKL